MKASIAALSALALLSTSDAFGSEDTVSCAVDGKKIKGRQACLAALMQPAQPAPRVVQETPVPRSTTGSRGRPSVLSAEPIPPVPVVNVFLRKSMDDLKSLSKPSALEDATGAVFSWSDDRVAGNRNWTAQALVAATINTTYQPQGTAYISESFTGVYFQVDRQLNSKDVSKNVDDLTFGGRHEFVLANALSTSHYIGVAGEIVTDGYGAPKNWNFTADYQPFGTDPGTGNRPLISYANWPLDYFKYVLVTVSPKLQTEYRGSMNGSTDPLFKFNNNVFRVGGSLGVNVAPSIFFARTGELPFLVARSSINVSYGWLYDIISDRQFDYLGAAYTFNLTETGDVGITFDYRHGKLQTTAQSIDLFKVALSAKFDYQPPLAFR